MEDPYTYDLSEFAREFTWALVFWNAAEQSTKQIVAELVGGSSATSIAVAMDMGNRAALNALRAAMREIDDKETREILDHLVDGFDRLLGYRNLYVHSLTGIGIGQPDQQNVKKLHGHIVQMKGEGRLRATTYPLQTSQVTYFKEHCRALCRFAQAIMNDLIEHSEWDLSGLMEHEPPSLDKPTWPKKLQNTPYYLQE